MIKTGDTMVHIGTYSNSRVAYFYEIVKRYEKTLLIQQIGSKLTSAISEKSQSEPDYEDKIGKPIRRKLIAELEGSEAVEVAEQLLLREIWGAYSRMN
jgi:hypothetical protein